MYDLPEHLSSLNALAPSPSSAPVMDQSAEDAVWNYLNTDELFRNFGVQPSELHQSKDEIASPDDKKSSPPADLKSFIEQFAAVEQQQQQQQHQSSRYDFGNMHMPFAGSSAPTPVVSTADIMPAPQVTPESWGVSPEEERPSGAKRLKQMGAGQAEIEEDSKRKRNTEASARFRAKKKEREQNLESRAKELEAQVAQLAADKASLENENRLLKAIVLGGGGGAQSNDAMAQLVGKRKRDQ